jgi:hypothetical protein
VKKLDPEFDLKLERQILRSVPAQMVLIPQSKSIAASPLPRWIHCVGGRLPMTLYR